MTTRANRVLLLDVCFLDLEHGSALGAYGTALSTKAVVSVNNKKSDIFSLNPNPATDYITINLDDAYTSTPEIDIIDMLGITINTSLLNPGIYFLRIHSGGKAETMKFVVLR